MPHTVELVPGALRELSKLDASVLPRIQTALQGLKEDPRPHGYTKLAGEEKQYRVRVGDYRIIYEIVDASSKVIVKAVRHRKDAYR
jgi:mRNA interferase RelE/StbE